MKPQYFDFPVKVVFAIGFLFLFLSPFAFAQDASEAKSQVVITDPSTNSYKGQESFFTGSVRVAPLFDPKTDAQFSAVYVTFDAKARTAWHLHPGGQHLIITNGNGYTQEWGKKIVKIKKGDVVWCPANIKHWHGAANGESMTHIALTGMKDGKNVEWLEKVTDNEYNEGSKVK